MPTTRAKSTALADLADLLLNVARLVRTQTPTPPGVVPLTETERQVMRVVDLHPNSSPSEIAARAHMQRTNVSAALRDLESKGMIRRHSTSGRGVAVESTQQAIDGLEALRHAWAELLTDAVDTDIETVRAFNDLLRSIEDHFLTA
ncbi:MarR family winged helix-turn-helix transcriptional regulator [Nocardioides sp. LS1]|uniref:MarR family winged helix-turn-helix transcriptional regulator n=1 Tax=Nocardioides sp. LS1 TaxID=1027620 RepID=UPI000F61F140|nr:MarR family winged helix-turn-helix transcriptional regulator [Nocardioides sp. LS1]GCD88093.1 hypothetical protein NLS1_00990 [Nocardioides sp. LS1]